MKKLRKWLIVLSVLLVLGVLCAVGVHEYREPMPLFPEGAQNLEVIGLQITQAGSSVDILISDYTDYDREAVTEYLKTCQVRRTFRFYGSTTSSSGVYFSVIASSREPRRIWRILLGGCNDCFLGGTGRNFLNINIVYELLNPREFVDTIIGIVDPQGELRLEVPME